MSCTALLHVLGFLSESSVHALKINEAVIVTKTGIVSSYDLIMLETNFLISFTNITDE